MDHLQCTYRVGAQLGKMKMTEVAMSLLWVVVSRFGGHLIESKHPNLSSMRLFSDGFKSYIISYALVVFYFANTFLSYLSKLLQAVE